MHQLAIRQDFAYKGSLARWVESSGKSLFRWKRRAILPVMTALIVVPLCGEALQDVETRRGVQYAVHDGVALAGDYYVPKGPGKFPVVVAMHGGAWQLGERTLYRFWGPYLAQRGIALFAIDYRLSKPGQPSYPKPVQDARAAIQFV